MKLPAVWEVPLEIRARISEHQGRQRALAADGHIVLVLYRVPQPKTLKREVVYFWRKPNGEWEFSERGAGIGPLKQLINDYEEVVDSLEDWQETADDPHDWHRIVERAAPMHRAARHMYEVLQEARQAIVEPSDRIELQGPCDRVSNIVRATELLQTDAQHAIDFSIAKQAEIQSEVNREQARAAYRLNILAALFLPMGTIASVFGMNLHSGLESAPSWMFWLVFAAGMLAGVGITAFVLNFNTTNLKRATTDS